MRDLPLEAFIHRHLSVRVTHGICPRCIREGFPNRAASMLDTGEEGSARSEHAPRRQGMEGRGDLLTLCAWCKSVQDPDGEWAALDVSLRHRLNTRVIYGICPHCAAARQA